MCIIAKFKRLLGCGKTTIVVINAPSFLGSAIEMQRDKLRHLLSHEIKSALNRGHR